MKVLALSGGGSGGLATALYLEHLEARVGPLHQKFDLIAGVSTGAIIATSLAGGMPAKELAEAYKRELPGIFKRSAWKFWAGYLGTSKYDKGPLKDALSRLLPIQKLGEAKTGLMIYANQIAPVSKTKFWKSWRPDDAGASAVSCVAASCSAPTYFAPEEYLDGVYVDGGLAMNDPGAPAVAEAIRRSDNSVVCLDLQVSYAEGMSPGKARRKVSAADWLPSIFSQIMSFGQDTSVYITQTMLTPPKYLSVNLAIQDALDATGSAFNAKCKEHADKGWLLSEDSVDDLLDRG